MHTTDCPWRKIFAAPLLLLAVTMTADRCLAAPLLPDLIPWDYNEGYDLDPLIDASTIHNRVLFRFHVAIPNIGDGPFEVREETNGTVSQTVYQRIYQSEGGITERVLGTFPDPANTFGHLWLQGLAQYNLYEALPDGMGGHLRGDLVSSQDKTSMGIVDSGPYDLQLPAAPATRAYSSANDPILGISVGWADIYDRSLPGQWVDVTGLASGTYFLQVVIDPYGVVEELDTTNNLTELLVNLTISPPSIHPGDYNDDGQVDAADYVVWRNTLGAAGLPPGTGADGNGNGMVDVGDHQVWRDHYGEQAAGAASGSMQVPEPTIAWAGMAWAGILLATTHRRRT